MMARKLEFRNVIGYDVIYPVQPIIWTLTYKTIQAFSDERSDFEAARASYRTHSSGSWIN